MSPGIHMAQQTSIKLEISLARRVSKQSKRKVMSSIQLKSTKKKKTNKKTNKKTSYTLMAQSKII